MTAGSQPNSLTGPQLPCLIACAATLTTTNVTASQTATGPHRLHHFMTRVLLSSVLVTDKLACHR